MADSTYDKFRKLLAELFMFDRADLDFGIYRIMNAKRDEVTRFLDDDLLPQVKQSLGDVDAAERAHLMRQLQEKEDQAAALDIDPDNSPAVQEIKRQLAALADPDTLEAEVFSHLYDFFRRYYKDGDFISLRRYKEGVYAIPYEGEEVKLYWANHDQYYIKSGEHFRDYAFKLADGRRVHFKLVQADEERDNTKAVAGQERRFILSESEPIGEETSADGRMDLIIPFEYRPDPQKRKQAELVAEAVARVLADEAAVAWLSGLAAVAPTEKNPKRTLLERHLNEYTARNTFDYFIHKDLGGFLRRELDFYIKNEVMHLDDIESEGEQRVVQYLAKIKAMRRIAHKIIDFLAQLEGFQKKLWLKKKFVVETNWCVTLDRVPEDLYPEIAANECQREEWVRLFAIDEIKGDLTAPAYSAPLTVEFLEANQSLVLDTALFDGDFKDRLLASFDDVDEQTDGLLIHGDNFHALRLLSAGYESAVKCVYIDPPYNTTQSEIIYKNEYKDSSWMTLLSDRLALAAPLLAEEGVLIVAIDDFELAHLCELLDAKFTGYERYLVVVNHHPQGGYADNVTRTHEYAAFLVPKGHDLLRGQEKSGEAEHRPFMRSGTGDNNFRRGRPNSFYAILVDPDSSQVVGLESPPGATASYETGDKGGLRRIYPIGRDGAERCWRRSYEGGLDALAAGQLVCNKASTVYIVVDGDGRRDPLYSNWTAKRYNAGTYGTNLIADVLGDASAFSYPKSLHTVRDSIEAATWDDQHAVVLDFFAGSGTTGHAVIEGNADSRSDRRFVLVEVGDCFKNALLPRLQRIVYSPEWEEGKPLTRDGGRSIAFRCIHIESYEDALNNLTLRRTDDQDRLLADHSELREDYTLRYMLDVESAGGASLLDLDRFEDPFGYTLRIGQGSVGETRPVTVDLVETFNYLLGLRVKHVDSIRGFRVVEGVSPQGERVLVIWRNTRKTSNAALDEFFQKQGYNTRDTEFDVVYVNGDNNLENLRRLDESWKVRLIEDDFKRLMFEVEDV